MIGDLGGAFDNIQKDVLLTTMSDMDLPGITDPHLFLFLIYNSSLYNNPLQGDIEWGFARVKQMNGIDDEILEQASTMEAAKV